jgi:hypothetical protein
MSQASRFPAKKRPMAKKGMGGGKEREVPIAYSSQLLPLDNYHCGQTELN